MEPIIVKKTKCWGITYEYRFELVNRNYIRMTKTDMSCSQSTTSYYYFNRRNTTLIKRGFDAATAM